MSRLSNRSLSLCHARVVRALGRFVAAPRLMPLWRAGSVSFPVVSAFQFSSCTLQFSICNGHADIPLPKAAGNGSPRAGRAVATPRSTLLVLFRGALAGPGMNVCRLDRQCRATAWLLGDACYHSCQLSLNPKRPRGAFASLARALVRPHGPTSNDQ